MDIAVLGLNHNTAPVELREQVAFGRGDLPLAFSRVRRDLQIPECVILSTCNRVELYTLVPESNGTENRLKEFLTRFHRLEPDTLGKSAYWYSAPHSVRHLFEVAAGLDSMVLGESEILGQVREAYVLAVSHGAVGSVFHRLFQTAIHAGKQVRCRTQIGRHATSVSSVAVGLARKIFQNLARKRVLVLGAGQTAQSAVQCLKQSGVGEITVVNRSLERALALAETVGALALEMGDLPEALVHADIVIASASADHFLLTGSQVHRIMGARRQRPLFLIDISVPRNLDPQIGRLENVYLYDIDDLEGIVAANRALRLKEAAHGVRIVEEEVEDFFRRYPSS